MPKFKHPSDAGTIHHEAGTFEIVGGAVELPAEVGADMGLTQLADEQPETSDAGDEGGDEQPAEGEEPRQKGRRKR